MNLTTAIDTPSRTAASGAYDAVVIGAGATGGLAALLLTEAGLRVLVLDAGVARSPARSFLRRLLGVDAARGKRRQPIQSLCYAWAQAPEAFVDDIDCPYRVPGDRPFVWFRARQLGGRMVIPGHGRQYYRLGAADFFPADGLSPAWPLRPGELDPWYAAVERRIGLAGRRDGLAYLPDSELARVLEPTSEEAALQVKIVARWPAVRAPLARFAPPFDALGIAARSGRLAVRSGAIAREIDVDGKGRARGVVWVDAADGSEHVARAGLLFLCASALESTRVLMLSCSARRPNGLGSASDVLGRYLMDHIKLSVEGSGPVVPGDPPEAGRCIYLPRFDARTRPAPTAQRGFAVQVYQSPVRNAASSFVATSFGEMLPRAENRVSLDAELKDAWGIPALRIECRHGDADLARAREQSQALRELANAAGVTPTKADDAPAAPGSANHECGTARMGTDPETSVLDANNECWDARGLYVTDGACLPSQGSQGPTLTLMALTARACAHALAAARGAVARTQAG